MKNKILKKVCIYVGEALCVRLAFCLSFINIFIANTLNACNLLPNHEEHYNDDELYTITESSILGSNSLSKMDKITKIKFRRDLLIALSEYIIQNTKSDPLFNEDPQAMADNIQYYGNFIKQTNEDFEKGRYRSISMWYEGGINDISNDYKFLSEYRQQFLDTYDYDLFDLYLQRRKTVDKIIASGKIKTDNQYYLIDEYVDELCQTNGDQALIDKLNKMIHDYYLKKDASMTKRKNK